MQPDQTLAQLLPISLAEAVAEAALLTRFDTKYATNEVTALQLIAELAPTHRILEIEGQRSFEYISTYLDSPERSSFRSHVQGRRRRYKCRVREYVDSGDTLIEVKVRGQQGQTVKYRQPCEVAPALDECAHFLEECLDGTPVAIPEALEPALEVRYRRVTLVALDGSERVTLDSQVSFTDAITRESTALPTGTWVVEVKSAKRAGGANRALRRLGERSTQMSKYIVGTALLHPEVRANRYYPVLRGLGVLPASA